MDRIIESAHFFSEFSAFIEREKLLSSSFHLQNISDKFLDFYHTLRVSDAPFEADGDMVCYSVGFAREINETGFVDARGLPNKLSWSTTIKKCITFRRQVYPVSDDEDARSTDYNLLAYFPCTETEAGHLHSSGWAAHPDKIENLHDFLASPHVSELSESIPERVLAYAS